MFDLLTWLQNWYQIQCDGEWEHEYGIKIYTLDNPGWGIKIDLIGTNLEKIQIDYKLVEKAEHDWFGYSVKDSVFDGGGDGKKLDTLITIFKGLVESNK